MSDDRDNVSSLRIFTEILEPKYRRAKANEQSKHICCSGKKYTSKHDMLVNFPL